MLLYVCRLESCPRPFPYPTSKRGISAHLRYCHGAYTPEMVERCLVDPESKLAKLYGKPYTPAYACPVKECTCTRIYDNPVNAMYYFIRHLETHPEVVVSNDLIRSCVINYPESEDGVEGLGLVKAGSRALKPDPVSLAVTSEPRIAVKNPELVAVMVDTQLIPHLPDLLQEIQAWRSENQARQASLESRIEASIRDTDRLKEELEWTLRRQDELISLAMLVHLGKEGHDVGVAIKNLVCRLINY